MRKGPLAVFASLALVAVGTASAGILVSPMPLATSLAVNVSSLKAGARPVAVTLKIHAELQCGRLTGGAIVFRFPAAERIPHAIAPADVTVAGQPATLVEVEGRNVTITPKPHTGVMCDVIAPGNVSVVLAKTANVGNPLNAGLYTISLMRGHAATPAQFRVR